MAAATEDRRTRKVHPAFLAAFERLGFLVTDWNQHLLTDEQLAEWESCLDEWAVAHPNEEPP